MKALVYTRYGPPSVVSLMEVPKPKPRPAEVLVRIHKTTVSSADWRARSLEMPDGFGLLGRAVFGFRRPRKPVLGAELSGVVESVGSEVTRFKAGDEVFAFLGARFGCHAEYRTVPEAGLIVAKPSGISFEQAACLSFGGAAALVFLRDKGQVRRGERVLVVGASGCVGSAAVQLAKHLGAEVTGVCSTANVALVRAIGADEVIDYTQSAFTETGETYDIILDTTGTSSMARCETSLNNGGRLLMVLATFAQSVGLERPRAGSGKRIMTGVAAVLPADVQLLADLAAASAFTPVIDRRFDLSEGVEAHAYVAKGRKRGSVVLSVR